MNANALYLQQKRIFLSEMKDLPLVFRKKQKLFSIKYNQISVWRLKFSIWLTKNAQVTTIHLVLLSIKEILVCEVCLPKKEAIAKAVENLKKVTLF